MNEFGINAQNRSIVQIRLCNFVLTRRAESYVGVTFSAFRTSGFTKIFHKNTTNLRAS